MNKQNEVSAQPVGRLMSIDFFRGITMFLLIGEFTGLFEHLVDPALDGTVVKFIGNQLHHHPWDGLHFWDLVQPFFMFIVGVAIPLSVTKRMSRGESQKDLIKHAAGRALILFVMGWALYCIDPGRITFRFQNVLCQLAVTYMVAFLIMHQKAWLQIAITFGILLATELLYRFFPLEGFNQAFEPSKNFGAWFDLLISGELSSGHWVSFNAFPTIPHTVWGVLAGKLLISSKSHNQKIKILLITGVVGLILGYSLSPFTPIIKRISTTSFVLATGGWTILALCFSYWIIEVKQKRKWAHIFVIVGMNPLFIYLFAHVGGSRLVYNVFKPFTMGLFSWTGELTAQIITGMATWAFLWYLCYWLYKKKIYIKI